MTELYVKPTGGLGNRMLAMDAAIRNKFSVKPKIIWERNRNLNCPFHQLFKLPDEVEILETVGFNKFIPKSYFQFYNAFNPTSFRWPWLNHFLGKERKHNLILYNDEFFSILEKDKDYLPLTDGSAYLAYHGRFGPISDKIFHFQPVEELALAIKKVTQSFSSKTIGIHIRRTDHEPAIRHSPLEVFIKKIQEENVDEQVNFFLSTDDLAVKNKLKNQFGESVITRDCKLNRTSNEGIKDALIDMYCLSKTRKIYGSYKSSFSQVSAELGEIKNHPIFIDTNESSNAAD